MFLSFATHFRDLTLTSNWLSSWWRMDEVIHMRLDHHERLLPNVGSPYGTLNVTDVYW